MDKRIDLGLSLAVAAAGLYICWTASQFRTGSFPDPLTTRGLPYITGGFMVLAGLFNAARRLLTWSHLPGNLTVSEGKEDDPSPPFVLGAALRHRRAGDGLVPARHSARLSHRHARHDLRHGLADGRPLAGEADRISARLHASWSGPSSPRSSNVILPLGPLTALARSWGLTP